MLAAGRSVLVLLFCEIIPSNKSHFTIHIFRNRPSTSYDCRECRSPGEQRSGDREGGNPLSAVSSPPPPLFGATAAAPFSYQTLASHFPIAIVLHGAQADIVTVLLAFLVEGVNTSYYSMYSENKRRIAGLVI